VDWPYTSIAARTAPQTVATRNWAGLLYLGLQRPIYNTDLNAQGEVVLDLLSKSFRLLGGAGFDNSAGLLISDAPDNALWMPPCLAAIPALGVIEVANATTPNVPIVFPAPPSVGTRVDLAFLECWIGEKAGAFASAAGLDQAVHAYGNPADLTVGNDISTVNDQVEGVEASRRIQFQFRIRTVAGVATVDAAGVFAQAGAASATSYGYTAVPGTSVPLYAAGHGGGNDAALLGTVDGYSYAMPIALVSRRANTAQIDVTDITDLRRPVLRAAALGGDGTALRGNPVIIQDWMGATIATFQNGFLTLANDPTAAKHAATKEYVDATVATGLSVATVPRLNGTETWSAAQTFAAGATVGPTLTLTAGTVTTAPLILPSGIALTTPQIGAVEATTTGLSWTDSAGLRHAIALTDTSQTLSNKTLDGGSNSFTNIPQSGISGLTAALGALAPLNAPTFTGTPVATTPLAGDNTTRIATTAFVQNAIVTGGAATAIGANYVAKSGSTMSGPLVSQFATVSSVNRTNLMPNPSFEGAIDPVVVSGPGGAASAVVTGTDAAPGAGTHCLALTVAAQTPTVSSATFALATSARAVVVAGTTYTFSWSRKTIGVPTQNVPVTTIVTWYAADGVSVVTTAANSPVAWSPVWTADTMTAVAPAAAVYANLSWSVGPFAATAIAASTWAVDALLLEASGTTGSYFDGSFSPFARWTGVANGSPSTLVMGETRTNLWKNPSFEVDLSFVQTGYVNGIGGTCTTAFNRLTTDGAPGAGSSCLQLAINAGTPTNGSTTDSLTTLFDLPVTAGTSYAFSLAGKYGLSTQANIPVRLSIVWLTSGGSTISQTDGTPTPWTNSWLRYGVTGTAPVTAAYAQLRWRIGPFAGTAIAANDWRFDAILFEAAPSARVYFDGDSGYLGLNNWSGTAHASTSTCVMSDSPNASLSTDTLVEEIPAAPFIIRQSDGALIWGGGGTVRDTALIRTGSRAVTLYGGLTITKTLTVTGTASVATPTAAGHATTKGYVDAGDASLWAQTSADLHNVNTGNIGIGIGGMPTAKLDLGGTLKTNGYALYLRGDTGTPTSYLLAETGANAGLILKHDGGVKFHALIGDTLVGQVGPATNFLNLNTGFGASFTTTSGPAALVHLVGGDLRIDGTHLLNLGGDQTKGANNGTIGYQSLSADSLDIVGAGVDTNSRKVKLWALAGVTNTGPLYLTGTTVLSFTPAGTPSSQVQIYASGIVRCDGGIQINSNNPAVTNDGWFNSYGTGGWRNQDQVGGWYMPDNTAIKSYGAKKVVIVGDATTALHVESGLLISDNGTAVGASATSAALATAGTITTALTGAARVNPAANVTGVILQAGTVSGQIVWVVNESAFTVTFDVAATSNVADGTTSAIAALSARQFYWDAGAARWFRVA
jgi:hypothetical protein